MNLKKNIKNPDTYGWRLCKVQEQNDLGLSTHWEILSWANTHAWGDIWMDAQGFFQTGIIEWYELP